MKHKKSAPFIAKKDAQNLLFKFVFFVEFIYATFSVHQLLLAGEEWVAFIANFKFDNIARFGIRFGSFALKFRPASANKSYVHIVRLNIFLHTMLLVNTHEIARQICAANRCLVIVL